MKKGLVIVGVILLVVGILLALVGMLPGLTAKKAADIEYTVSATGMDFKDYSNGDTFIITGEITEKNSTGGYMYLLDNKVPVTAGEDIGNKGDTVTLEVEVVGISMMGITVETLKATAKYNIMNILVILGIVLLIVGIILMIVGAKKGAPAAAPPAGPPAQPPMGQPPMQQPPVQPPMQQPPMPPQ